MPSRRSPVRHKVKPHTRQGKSISSFERGSGSRPQRSSKVVGNEHHVGYKRKKYRRLRLPEEVSWRDLPEARAPEAFYEEGWLWIKRTAKNYESIVEELVYHGYSEKEVRWFDEFLLYVESRDPPKEVYGKRKIRDWDTYFKFVRE